MGNPLAASAHRNAAIPAVARRIRRHSGARAGRAAIGAFGRGSIVLTARVRTLDGGQQDKGFGATKDTAAHCLAPTQRVVVRALRAITQFEGQGPIIPGYRKLSTAT